MLNLKAFALAGALVLAAGGMAVAEDNSTGGSALDALTSANSVSIQTVSGIDATTRPGELVDLGSLKARIQGSPELLAQLESYGATIDDVVGITGTSPTDVTILVQG